MRALQLLQRPFPVETGYARKLPVLVDGATLPAGLTASGDEDGGPGGLARLKVAVRLHRIGKRIALIDCDV